MAENDIKRPELVEPVAQEAKLVGDDATEVRKVPVEVNAEQVDAQVAQPREADSDKVNVHETAVATDEVITDPSDPRAVQVPEAGRGSLDLPAHRLAAPTVEDVFAESAPEAVEVSDEDRKENVRQGVSSGQAEVKYPEPTDDESEAPSSDESERE